MSEGGRKGGGWCVCVRACVWRFGSKHFRTFQISNTEVCWKPFKAMMTQSMKYSSSIYRKLFLLPIPVQPVDCFTDGLTDNRWLDGLSTYPQAHFLRSSSSSPPPTDDIPFTLPIIVSNKLIDFRFRWGLQRINKDASGGMSGANVIYKDSRRIVRLRLNDVSGTQSQIRNAWITQTETEERLRETAQEHMQIHTVT